MGQTAMLKPTNISTTPRARVHPILLTVTETVTDSAPWCQTCVVNLSSVTALTARQSVTALTVVTALLLLLPTLLLEAVEVVLVALSLEALLPVTAVE